MVGGGSGIIGQHGKLCRNGIMSASDSNWMFKLEDCVPSLRQELEQHPLNLEKIIRVALLLRIGEAPTPVPRGTDRRSLYLTDGKDFCIWAAGLAAVAVSGDKKPPVLATTRPLTTALSPSSRSTFWKSPTCSRIRGTKR